MPSVNFEIHVTHAGDRATATLAAVAEQLDLRLPLVPDQYGTVRLWLRSPPDAYDFVTAMLDDIDPSWDDYLLVRPPPPR